MHSARGWARLVAVVVPLTVLGIVGCDEEDAALAPLVDDVPPSVAINSVTSTDTEIEIKASASDFIAVTTLIVELRDPNQLVTEVTLSGDSITLGRLLAVDTTTFAGRVTSANVTVKFLNPFAQATLIDVRVVGIDSQLNEGIAQATVIIGGGGSGGLGTPIVAITSPLPNQTVRDNTLIRVGISASDPTGLAQLNVLLTGLTTVPQADTTRFAVFRTNVDTLLDFFIPSGNLGTLTINAEAINLNSISGFASITVTVAQVIANDVNPPQVSLLVTGGVLRRLDEAPRMETNDSLLFTVTASDNETAITRIGVTYVVSNATTSGTVTQTLFQDSVLNPAISGTVPVTFTLTPQDLPISLFDPGNLPDTLFFEVTGWAFDQATPSNCGATVDVLGTSNSLACTGTGPVLATGLTGGRIDRLIVAGRTIGFAQGSLIADATVDTLRELLLLSDFEFGLVRPFDLRNEVFLNNVPVGSQPWGVFIDNSEDNLLVGNSGGTNISLIDLGPRIPGSVSIVGETERFQTQDLKVFLVEQDFDAFGLEVFPVTFFDFSDRPQFVAQAANGLILFSTKPAAVDRPGTIREYDPVLREIRFFIAYADRKAPGTPQIQVVNADSVFAIEGGRRFVICDHTPGSVPPSGRSCITAADSLGDAEILVAVKAITDGWDVDIFTDLSIPSIGLQDTTFLAASGDREFIALGEGDTPERAGRIIMYRSATQTISSALQVSDLTGNAEERVFGLALNRDGSLGVARGAKAYFFGPDFIGGPNVLRLLGINDGINTSGTGAALHPDNDQFSFNVSGERLSFLGSDDASVEIVDTRFFEFSRGKILIRDPITGPLKVTRRLPTDPANVIIKLYGITANGVVVIPIRDVDVIPLP